MSRRILTGYEEIAMYLAINWTGRCSERTARRYVEEHGLPVTRRTLSGSSPVIAHADDVDRWCESQMSKYGQQRTAKAGNAG